MIELVLLVNRQGKVRLAKWYKPESRKNKLRTVREIGSAVIKREKQKLCNFMEWKDKLVVFKRYASLFFCAVIERKDNELLMLEVIHHFVETLDGYFGNVCELDIIFNFHKAYFILDELIIAGQLQETSKRKIIQACHAQDLQMEEGKDGKKDDKKGI
mmetsp:Transcript_32077/g.78134  ORF Transcript_32077/g.78134 Transcript_32077/m.78134 type:complete len:158 (-) Transcript_32077:175-648(-)|eukprot:CAMPEP_0114519548 /NCGR_PEP_ID=MMETSP0109-20121206/19073_1 /TAXON_ID=29199 /ORGANISM="Chlorarachnion reptans, Strain CCCM449" /LENGTH=157 /DNA_ID=CAMNT_0001700317 /DNA_START=116 /DNA_END=589 /DNA_ORIENTATION=+